MKNKIKSTNLIEELASDKFINFCQTNIIPSLKPLEKKRINYIILSSLIGLIGIIFCTLFFISAIIPCYKENASNMSFMIQLLIVAAGLFIYAIYKIIKSYKNKAKRIVYEKLFSYWGTFKYYPKESINISKNIEYIQVLKLFKRFNRYSSEDFISGKFNGNKVDIQELDLKYVTGSGKNRRVETIFKGVLAITNSNKEFKGCTVITTDKGILNNLNSISGLKNIKLEDPIFEKIFEVYGSDQIESRYLLTTGFMNRLVKIACRNKDYKIMCSFENEKINLAFESSKDWFELPILKPVTEIENYQSVLLELFTILSVFEELKIDENIGL